MHMPVPLSVMLFAVCILATSRIGLADGSDVLDIPACASLTADCGFTSALTEAGGLTVEKLRVFAATPPYRVPVNGQVTEINIGNRARYFDFSGDRPFVNPTTGVPDIAAINAASDSSTVAILGGAQISNAGVPGRVFRHEGRTLLRYMAGDPPVAGKCRSQFASYPVPARQRFVFDLSFQLGELVGGHEWHLTPPGISPVAIWQLKAPEVHPSLAIVIDTDPANPARLLLSFTRKSAYQSEPTRIGNPVRIETNQPIRVLMDMYLDEREISTGGRGYWRVSMNGKQVLDVFGPTLSAVASEPHQWFLTLYMFNNPQPQPFNRTILWKRARMLQATK